MLCMFDEAVKYTALIIISVFPKATSPTISLSEGILLNKSDFTSSITFN